MSKHFKAIIPLLSDDLTLKDIDQKEGFVGMYSYDVNRPTLDQHIFLLYLYNITDFFRERDKRLKESPLFKSRKVIRIKGFLVVCYTFYNNNESIRTIEDNRWFINDEDKLKIFKFWNFTDDDINKYMLHPETTLLSETFEHVVIPEWDLPKSEIVSQIFTIPL